MAKIWNKHDRKTPKTAVYVGRPTIFGNPFSHLDKPGLSSFKVGSRAEAIEKYSELFEEKLKDPEFYHAVELLRGKDLVCWCVPKPCHAQVILDYLERTK